ncbi:MAG: hypothetical protein NT167_22795 [Verrucomicrobia bacterium]|nr:hypothetical protein [Verrucomicrobiota bacterium]
MTTIIHTPTSVGSLLIESHHPESQRFLLAYCVCDVAPLSKCFIGRCPGLILGGVHGNDEAKVYAELCVAVEEMIELIHADGQEMPRPLGKQEFNGKFVLAP